MTKYMHSLTASRLPSLIPRYRELFVYAHDQRHPFPDQLQSAAADQSQAAVADQPHPPFPWLPLAAPPPRVDGFFPSWPLPFSLGKGKVCPSFGMPTSYICIFTPSDYGVSSSPCVILPPM